MSVDEKISLLDYLVDDGIEPTSMMPGTGCCALTDTVRLTAHAVRLGCAGALMLPPFYYKGVSDDGLFRSYSEIIERVGSPALRIYLYHIPPVAQVGISVELVDRLVRAYPETVVGIKDSSGDWDNTHAMLERGWDDFRIFVGSETLLLKNMRGGGAGCISATANINPHAIHRLYSEWESDQADQLQKELTDLRSIVQAYPMIPALKAVVAQHAGNPDWCIVRPPLTELTDEQRGSLAAELDAAGFRMAGLR